MRISHTQRLLSAWLVLSLLLTFFLFAASHAVLESRVREHISEHLLLTLDESHFSSTQDTISDSKGLQRIALQMNTAMEGLIVTRWYAPQQDCSVRLQRVDDVTVEGETLGKSIVLDLHRKQIERQVELGMSCETNGWIAVALCVFLGLLFLIIGFALPPPLSKPHRSWINYLLGHGYNGQEAFDIVSRYDASSLALNDAQLACLDRLHDGQQHNFSRVLEVVTDTRVAALTAGDIDWLLLGLQNGGELDAALALASAVDSIEIDLNTMLLRARGLEIPMSRTPLFYYAWYAMNRVNGDGWITNPASNRPDPESGRDLASLMGKYGGHGKAINDLEQVGLKARTLDQNRSKMKDDLVAVLGENLAGAYLFESKKHPDGIRMSYCLRIAPEQISLIM